MTIHHSFLAVFTISQRKRHYEVCKSSNMRSQLYPACTKIDTADFTAFQNEVFSSNIDVLSKYESKPAFYRPKSKLAHCKLKPVPNF